MMELFELLVLFDHKDFKENKVYSELNENNDLSEKLEQLDHKVFNEKNEIREILGQHDILMAQRSTPFLMLVMLLP
jgi:hypothetical protein